MAIKHPSIFRDVLTAFSKLWSKQILDKCHFGWWNGSWKNDPNFVIVDSCVRIVRDPRTTYDYSTKVNVATVALRIREMVSNVQIIRSDWRGEWASRTAENYIGWWNRSDFNYIWCLETWNAGVLADVAVICGDGRRT